MIISQCWLSENIRWTGSLKNSFVFYIYLNCHNKKLRDQYHSSLSPLSVSSCQTSATLKLIWFRSYHDLKIQCFVCLRFREALSFTRNTNKCTCIILYFFPRNIRTSFSNFLIHLLFNIQLFVVTTKYILFLYHI